jgi:ATP-dependent DNA helicase RecG
VEEDRKREIRRHIAQGNAQLIIGTHALIEQKVEFGKLGLVIVDEQHRFGVMQRFKLMKKSGDEGRGNGHPRTATDTVTTHAGADAPSTSLRTGPVRSAERNSAMQGEPDVLVMTATPIPRTLALTLYGDLDISILDEMPPGRTPIVTRRVSDDRADEVWQFVGKQVAAGHQAYVVYPVIEENEESELKAAIKMHKELSKEDLSPTGE